MEKILITFKNFGLLDENELRLVYQWRNLDYIRENMDNPNVFSYDSHIRFCQRKKKKKDKIYFLVYVNNNPCAVLDFVNINERDHSAESGFYIIREHNEYAYPISRCANSLCNHFGLIVIRTHVLKFNTKAILYNLMKLKGNLVKEDDKAVYFEFYSFPEDYDNDPFFSKYSFKIIG